MEDKYLCPGCVGEEGDGSVYLVEEERVCSFLCWMRFIGCRKVVLTAAYMQHETPIVITSPPGQA